MLMVLLWLPKKKKKRILIRLYHNITQVTSFIRQLLISFLTILKSMLNDHHKFSNICM